MIFVCGLLDDWVRAKIVFVSEITLMFIGHLTLLCLYNPSTNYNKSFPFHTMTKDLDPEKSVSIPSHSVGRSGSDLAEGSGVDRESSDNPFNNNLLNSISGGGGSISGGGIGEDGKLIIKNPYENHNVDELRRLNRGIQNVIEGLISHQDVLQNVLNNIEGGGTDDYVLKERMRDDNNSLDDVISAANAATVTNSMHKVDMTGSRRKSRTRSHGKLTDDGGGVGVGVGVGEGSRGGSSSRRRSKRKPEPKPREFGKKPTRPSKTRSMRRTPNGRSNCGWVG